MKIHDNRHLDFSDKIEVGDMILCEDGKYYLFSYDCNEEENCPYLQIDVSDFQVVDSITRKAFFNMNTGTRIPTGGVIEEIHKNKNLIIDIRS